MLYYMLISNKSKFSQIVQNENVQTTLEDFDHYLKNKGILCYFFDKQGFFLISDTKRLECKMPSYCFKENDDTIKLALIITFIIKKIRGNF